jgi:pimeloyl-ACP methyl ester carboxylesterase
LKHRRIATSAASSSSRPSRRGRANSVIGGALLASAVALGAAALVTRVRARKAERAHPPRGRFIEIDGVRIHYLERGDGPVVVLLHGNGAMVEDYEISGVLDLAARDHRVIAFDRPGFGYTDRPCRQLWTHTAQAELLHRAFTELGIKRPIVVGHSWGTLVALALALEHPTDVGGLVLLSGYYFPTMRADVVLLSPPAIPIVGDVMRYTISPLIGRLSAPKLIRKIFSPAPVTGRFAAEFPIELMLRPSQIRASAADTALMIPAATAISERLGELAMPIAIMAGEEDEIVDVARQSGRLHKELPASELRLVRGAGHMVHHMSPSEVVDLIRHTERRASDRGGGLAKPAE